MASRILHRALPSVLICAAVFALVFALWRTGRLQFFELQLYDLFLRAHARDPAAGSEVVIVGITEADLQSLNAYPVPDDVLSDTLQLLVDGQPAAIVVDLFRNLPVPGRDLSGRQRLASIFARNPNIIAIQLLGLGNQPSVPPPPFLSQAPEQVGFNDFAILDQKVDEIVRRVSLMMWQDGHVYYSDTLLAALLYLQTHEIDYQLNEEGSRDLRLGKARLRAFEENDGAYVNADSHGYQMLLNFRGPASFDTFSFTTARSGKIPPAALRGKVVFVGPMATSLKDFISTPLGTRFPGLLLHAHIVNQLLRGALYGEPQLRFWREWQETLWLLAWCAAGTVAGAGARSPLLLALAVLGGVCVLAAAWWLALVEGLWILGIAPAAGFIGTAALSTSHHAYLERKQRDVLMLLFSRHVSTEIAADIWNHRDQFMDGNHPKAQTLFATVFFTDLKGFTAMAETLTPEALIDWLNEYMEVMSDLVEQHGGMVNKYIGDAIMAIFGAPVRRTSQLEMNRDASNAVRCALAMGRHLDRLNAQWAGRGLPVAFMRIGIASGPLVGGSIGGSKRLEYSVAGDTVVIAKRLESIDKQSDRLEKATASCRILMNERTFSMLGPEFIVRGAGPMRLDGRDSPAEVYVLTGDKPGLAS